ncbi:MAG: hypothetical protein NW201_08900 [Gemmatimonadales bacterium]|nr:hypothetical protein [Gemmatimonadales bacterium]
MSTTHPTPDDGLDDLPPKPDAIKQADQVKGGAADAFAATDMESEDVGGLLNTNRGGMMDSQRAKSGY